jgi:hypothetical protein
MKIIMLTLLKPTSKISDYLKITKSVSKKLKLPPLLKLNYLNWEENEKIEFLYIIWFLIYFT